MSGIFSLKEKSLTKRMKTTRACDECRKRKVKCDGKQPCAKCLKGNNECIFVKMTKRPPPKSYMENVESRLERVESSLKSIVGKNFEGKAESDSTEGTSVSAPYNTDHLNSQIDRFTINEIGQAVYVNDLYSRADRIPNKTNRAHSNDDLDLSSLCDSPLSSASISFTESIRDHLAADKNTISEAEPLLEIYFDHVHKYIPMIHRPSFLKQIQSTINPPSRLIVYAMCAVASRWTFENYPIDKLIPPGYTYYQKALGLLDDFFDVPRVSTVQALILLVKYQEYFQKVGYFHRSHAYLGIAARMCIDLGLPDLEGDSVEAEIGKRTFWATFIYDLFINIEQGRDTFFDPSSSAGYPSATLEESAALEEALVNHNACIQLCKILSLTYSAVRRFAVRKQMQGDHRTKEQTIEEHAWLFSIHTHLENFFYELSHDPNSSLGECQIMHDPFVGFLYLTYHFCIILLHQSYIEGPDASEHDFIPYQHQKLCYSAASSITHIVESLQNRFPVDAFVLPIRGVQHSIHCLTAAATIHQYQVTKSESSIAKDMAHRQRLLTLSLMQMLSRHSPSLETLKYLNTIQSIKTGPTSYQGPRTIPGNRKARPVSMTFLENQTRWPTDSSYPAINSQRPRSVTWSDLACMDLQSNSSMNEQLSEALSSPTYYQEQPLYNPIPSMGDLFLIDDQENQDVVMEM